MSSSIDSDPPSAGTRTDRVFKLAELLRAQARSAPMTAEALAEALRVSVRTIYRDVETLRANGLAVTGAAGVGFRFEEERGEPAAMGRGSESRRLAVAPAPLDDRVGLLRQAVRAAHRAPEADIVAKLANEARFDPAVGRRVLAEASRLVGHLRENRQNEGGIDRFMHEYSLSSEEGVALMCLAEALLRIPDADTADALIEDKIGGAQWEKHFGKADSLFVNASTLGLMISGRVLRLGAGEGLSAVLGRLIHHSGEPVIRAAIRQAMRIMGRQFVMGRDIGEALQRAREDAARGYRHSFDMLGEAAYTDKDARNYLNAYLTAIAAVGAEADGAGPVASPGVSVKLSALHPRYEPAQRERVISELYPRLLQTAEAAANVDIGLCVDAEEMERLDLSLELFSRLAQEPSLKGWDGLGLAVQAYSRRARPLIEWLADLAGISGRRFMARLVKGAYWDTEIKRAQEAGMSDFPVFTRKEHTDVSYLACAKAMFAAGARFYPSLATHNAHTVAAVAEMAAGREDWEFQRLHGMGAPLYDPLMGEGARCRIYAPVGGHEDLLAYLVRRLLENGANTSFVNRIVDDALPVEEIVADPVAIAERGGFGPHEHISTPGALFAPRENSLGVDLSDPEVTENLALSVAGLEAAAVEIHAEPLTSAEGNSAVSGKVAIANPANASMRVGMLVNATPALAADALARAIEAQPYWDGAGAEARAAILERAASLYEANGVALMRLAVREAGKTWKDAVAELREAVDFLRYYAAEARRLFAEPTVLPGPTGERNTLKLSGRGAFLCISPWNFPLAIFTGQVAAALAAGNAVLAKPAEQTSLIAYEAVRLLHQAGVPRETLHLLPGDGPSLGEALLADPHLGGVAFTGSTDVARIINRKLAARDGPIIPLIAETGGINAMIVDSSALPEQVTRDLIASAFQSAGQRCSAARIAYVPEETAERQIEMLAGAMAELRVGDPAWLSTDVGPVIDVEAKQALDAHAGALRAQGRLLAETPLSPDARADGFWVAPQLYRVDGIEALQGETFGPILHVATWASDQLDEVIDAINAAGYGLTLGVHTRIEARAQHIIRRARVGNIYVNRNQIGAIVGSQPFGGEGLSGTGPKAGGPHYLARFAVERVASVDLTAQGGDAALMTL
ncbi:MAG: bifunctional proline dehydrogenase/L-glutamate gamma-semialdehyde dehydrogenase PutA [Rhodobacteraceae bacterium]|nr:bifunctional proline dehydrogenase/L-glutamate gamma-semialdehyde dehydrogenase PutA [Paracoccaceae bacterium]